MSEELETQAVAEPQDEAKVDLPDRLSKDSLPIKPTWQVAVMGAFYFLLGLMLGWLTLFMFLGEGTLTWISWIFAIMIILGTFSALYTAWDELRHIQHARQLDAHGVETKARIIDRWTDHYVDGGVYTRKKINHILYTYNDGKNFGKHAINKSASIAMNSAGWIDVVYLPEQPEIFRLKI